MAELNITPEGVEPIVEPILPPNEEIIEQDNEQNNILGLTKEELKDANAIQVYITDTKSPIIILFGPPTCGKTMMLVRLTRYLKSQNYKVVPERNFRPSYDSHYQRMCDQFDEMVNSDKAQKSTELISFMLVKVLDSVGRTICQILEAPGEYYFKPTEPNNPFPRYVNEIIASNARKIWALIVDPTWINPFDRANYVNKMHILKTEMLPKDKVLFVFNKIDKTNYVMGPGQIQMNGVIGQLTQEYPNIFNKFLNTNPITSIFRKYDFELVPFQTGKYNELQNGGSTYTISHDNYPRRLWDTLLKMIRG